MHIPVPRGALEESSLREVSVQTAGVRLRRVRCVDGARGAWFLLAGSWSACDQFAAFLEGNGKLTILRQAQCRGVRAR